MLRNCCFPFCANYSSSCTYNNADEIYHRMVRKSKKCVMFPTNDAIRKVIYMILQAISKKWNMPVRNWKLMYY